MQSNDGSRKRGRESCDPEEGEDVIASEEIQELAVTPVKEHVIYFGSVLDFII